MAAKLDLAALRREYSSLGLDEQDMAADPTVQLQAWLSEAVAAQLLDATAMCLSTATPGGTPSARIVLLKGVDAQGLTFFTRYSSRKGVEIQNNAQVSLVFHWSEVNRQVRICGSASKTSQQESLEYFQSRPRESRIAARVASGRETVADRAALERLFAEEDRAHPGENVPMPDDWGGYRIVPYEFEFWQGRENRLHDRLLYTPGNTPGTWTISRLAP